MKRDFRRQTFSKPGKPDDDEIKRLTSDKTENAQNQRSGSRKKCTEKSFGEIRQHSAEKNDSCSQC